MAANYLPYDPQQMMLLPESLQEWLPEGHLAHFISDAIDGLDLGAFHARYEKEGPRNQPFHPAMMVKVLVYGYATGVFSSRKIARKLHEDVAFRVLAARNFPAHRTIRDFRAFHLKELSDLFVQVVRLAREMGLVKLGTIAVDGTKVKANASRHKAMSYGHMLKAEAELKAQIEGLLNKARAADEAEKNEPELDIPAEIARRQDRLDAIAAARTRLEQRQRDTDLERGRSDDDDHKPRGQDGKPKGGRYKQPFGVPQDKDQDMLLRLEEHDDRKPRRFVEPAQSPAAVVPEVVIVGRGAAAARDSAGAVTRRIDGVGRAEHSRSHLTVEGERLPLLGRRHFQAVGNPLVELLGRLRHPAILRRPPATQVQPPDSLGLKRA